MRRLNLDLKFNYSVGILTVILTAAVILLFRINTPIIPFTDEILFEEASFEAAQGQWIIPHYNQQVWLEKPPLYFWLTAPIFHLSQPFLSTNPLDLTTSMSSQQIYLYPWIRRFWSFISFVTILSLSAWLANLITKKSQVAYFTVLVAVSTPIFLYIAQSASLDILATAFITISVCGLLKLIKGTHFKRYFLLYIIAVSAALMTRSLLAATPLGL